MCITIPCIVWLWCQQAQDLTTLWCPWKDCWSQAAKTSAEGKLQFVSKSGVPTIYTRKTEILVDKSDGLHQSKNMGCDLRQYNFSTLCTLFSWFGYTAPYGGLFSTASIFIVLCLCTWVASYWFNQKTFQSVTLDLLLITVTLECQIIPLSSPEIIGVLYPAPGFNEQYCHMYKNRWFMLKKLGWIISNRSSHL